MDDFALQKVAEFVAVPACSRIRDEDRCRYAGAGAGGWRGCELNTDDFVLHLHGHLQGLYQIFLGQSLLPVELELPLARFRLGGEVAIHATTARASDANGRR